MDLIDYYYAIENSSEKMLEATKTQDLEAVVRYEGVCAVLIEQLRHRGREQQLLPDQRTEKLRIMQRILRNDAEIRQLAEPWLGDIEQLIDGSPRVLH